MQNPRFSGVALNEYVLIGAMMVLVAVPALFFLGGALHDNLDGTVNASIADLVPELRPPSDWGKLPGQGGSSGGSSGGASGGGKPAVKIPRAFFDRSKGALSYRQSPTAGGEIKHLNAKGGTLVLANELQLLAKTWTNAKGEPLPPGVQALLQKLANQASVLGSQQLQADNSKDPSGNNHLKLLAEGAQLAQTYEELLAQLDLIAVSADGAPNKDIQSLRDQLNLNAGLISTMNYEYYVKSIPVAALKSAKKKVPELEKVTLEGFDLSPQGLTRLKVGESVTVSENGREIRGNG